MRGPPCAWCPFFSPSSSLWWFSGGDGPPQAAGRGSQGRGHGASGPRRGEQQLTRRHAVRGWGWGWGRGRVHARECLRRRCTQPCKWACLVRCQCIGACIPRFRCDCRSIHSKPGVPGANRLAYRGRRVQRAGGGGWRKCKTRRRVVTLFAPPAGSLGGSTRYRAPRRQGAGSRQPLAVQRPPPSATLLLAWKLRGSSGKRHARARTRRDRYPERRMGTRPELGASARYGSGHASRSGGGAAGTHACTYNESRPPSTVSGR